MLRDLWLAEVEAEFLALLNHSRDVGVDAGNQFRAFEQLLDKGVDTAWPSLGIAGRSKVYVLYGRHAFMFYALAPPEIAIVKWDVIGSEYEQRLSREEALRRAASMFPM